MNELLRWYGYDDKVDRKDTVGLNLKKFDSNGNSAEGRDTNAEGKECEPELASSDDQSACSSPIPQKHGRQDRSGKC